MKDPIKKPEVQKFNKELNAGKKLTKAGNPVAKKRGTSDGHMVTRQPKGFSKAEKGIMKKIDSAKKISGSM